MKQIMEFNLPEDKEELELYQKAPQMHSAIWEVYQWARAQDKYSEETSITYADLRAKLAQIFSEHEVDF